MTSQEPVRILHYLNQFFAGIGGEDHANDPPRVMEGAVGPGRALQGAFGASGQIVATVAAGDNYAVENEDELKATVLEAVARYRPTAIAAGPAFDAGRYGLACGQVCKIAEEAGIPAVAAMHPDNAGITTYRRSMICIPTGSAVAEMPQVVRRMASLIAKIASGTGLGSASEDGYIPRGYRKDVIRKERGATRAINMVLARINGAPFESEIVIRDYDRVTPPPPLSSLSNVQVAVVTSGGLVPKGNPDKLAAARADTYFRYSIAGMSELAVGEWESIHGGYGHHWVNEGDPNYVVPLRSLRVLEARGAIGSLYPEYVSTVGNQTSVANAQRFGRELAAQFQEADVGAVVLVPT